MKRTAVALVIVIAAVGLDAQAFRATTGMGGMGTGVENYAGGIIDPPPGPAFRDPPEAKNLSTKPGIVEIDLVAGWTKTEVAGTTATLMTYNGTYPSPVIRARRGDILRVTFHNRLPRGPVINSLNHDLTVTNLHTHGLHVSPLGNSDNSTLAIKPGEVFRYEFDLSKQEPGTLNYYHPHAHGSVAEQVWAGLGGALVIEDESQVLAGYETHLMVLKDLSLVNGVPAPHWGMMDFMSGKEGDIVTVNGQRNPVLSIRPGQVQRWRFLNASTARFYHLSLEGQPLYIVGTDGGLLDKPYRVEYIPLAPGERVDVLVQGSASPGRVRLLSLPISYSMMGGMMGGAQQVTLLTLETEGSPVADSFPAVVDASAARVSMNLDSLTHRRLAFSMGMGVGAVNGVVFTEQNFFTVTSTLGTWEVWEVVNQTPMAHPFHQHVNAAQVLSITGGDPGYARLLTTAPAWKDTTILPPGGTVTLLVPVRDFAGMAMFHCHILEHEDIGMMGMWEIK